MVYKLIVADSSPTIQKTVKMAFSDSEFEIYAFNDGIEVMNSLGQISPDAVLLNLFLPRRDGYEVGFFLKSQEEFKQTSLILLKGAFDPLDKKRIAGLDYDEIVQEPFDSERLVSIVRELIEQKKDPQTLPEEPVLDEIPLPEASSESEKDGAQGEALPQAESLSRKEGLSSLSPKQKSEIEDMVRDLMKEEILSVEREVEKRIRAKILAELQDLSQEQLEKIKRQIGRKS